MKISELRKVACWLDEIDRLRQERFDFRGDREVSVTIFNDDGFDMREYEIPAGELRIAILKYLEERHLRLMESLGIEDDEMPTKETQS